MLAGSDIGKITSVTFPVMYLPKNAKHAWIKTSKVIVGRSSFAFLSVKHLRAVAKRSAPPIPIDALIAPIKANTGYNRNKNFDFVIS